MEELIQTNTLNWENYQTKVLTEKKLKDFLMSEAISCLSSRFKEPKEFYEEILFKIPKTKNNKKFIMIYSHLIEFYPYNYLTKEELAKKHNLEIKNIIAEGSLRLMDTSLENAPMVRWLIIKEE